MAPSPEHDKEPKAPDKTNIQTSDNDLNDLQLTNSDQQANLDTKTVTSGNNADIEENAQIETLDDGQLRALLDEAITYKRPKDREGKSLLFKELLEEAEQDEEAGAEVWRRRGGGGRSGSLQELAAAALYAEPPRRRAPAAPSAAARAHHGGSLPSGVDTHTDGHRHPFLFSEEVCGGRSAGAPADYIATVHCVNPPPLAERRVSVCEPPNDEDQGTEMDIITRTGKLPHIHMMYTARATHEIVNTVPSISSSRAHTTTTSSSQIDSGISFGCITTPAVVASCSTTTSVPHNTTTIDPKPLQLASSYCSVKSITGLDSAETGPGSKCSAVGGIRDGKEGSGKAGGTAVAACSAAQSAAPIQIGSLGTTHRSVVNIQHRSVIAMGGLASLSRSQYSAGANSASTSNDDYKKSLDENGNALQSFSAGSSGSQHKKRRKKWTRNETVAMSEQIDGYQGHKDLSELLRFIESDRAPPPRQSKQRDEPDDRSAKKRSIERRAKDKVEAKMKKASSMEELSCTKLEDLTDDATNEESLSLRKTKKHSTGDSTDTEPRKSDRRSWGNDSRDTFFTTDLEDRRPISPARTNPAAVTPIQSAKIEKKKVKPNKAPDATPETAVLAEVAPPVESLEFQTVTKKKRTRKRHSPYDENRSRNGNNGYGTCSKECTPRTGTRYAPAVLSAHDRDILYNKFRTPGSPEHRRKSASSVPPSDKSNDSNDDLDSVHSLPVESTAEKMSLQQVSASSGGTPQASYADIARFSGPHVPCPALASPPATTIDIAITPPSTAVVSILNVSKNADKWPCVSKISLTNPSSPPACADMPNGLVATGVKSPPAAPIPNSHRGHNIPDLIESCNFYTNDTIPSKCPVDVDNTKNVYAKETVSNAYAKETVSNAYAKETVSNTFAKETVSNAYPKETVLRTESLPADFPRTKNTKTKIAEADSTADSANNQTYNMENYPALDSKNQKNTTLKPKIDKKTPSKHLVSQPSVAVKPMDKKVKQVIVNKPGWKETNNIEGNYTSGGSEEVMLLDNFSSFVKAAVTNMDSKADVNYKSPNMNINKMGGLLHNKLDGIVSKPPDVVMPLTEMTHDAIRQQPIECRPAVIILNEEIKKSTENVSDIDGITFGFDINEQLLNGEIVSDPNLTMLLETPISKLDSEDLQNDNAGMTILYNSNIEFPAINEKPHRENRPRNVNDEYSKHSKKSTRNYKDISKGTTVGNSDLDNNNECKPNCVLMKDKVRTESVAEGVINLSEQNNKCDLVKDAALKLVSLPNVEIVEAKVGNDVSLRYLAPAAGPKEVYNLDKIVHYVGMAWEDIMKCPGSKVHYFNDNQ